MKVPFLKLIVRKIRKSIAIVEEGNTVTHSGGLAVGKYVIWKGTQYKVTTAMSYGETISGSKLSAVSDGIANELNTNITNLVKEIHYELPENVTIATNDYYTKTFANVGLPNGAKVLSGYVNGYTIQNANGLIISESSWYSTHYINIFNIYKNSCTLTQGTIVCIYYIE